VGVFFFLRRRTGLAEPLTTEVAPGQAEAAAAETEPFPPAEGKLP
jgi:hypothetical protein